MKSAMCRMHAAIMVWVLSGGQAKGHMAAAVQEAGQAGCILNAKGGCVPWPKVRNRPAA